MRFHLTRNLDEFASHAEGFLAERLDCNVMATVVMNARAGVFAPGSQLFAYGVGDDGDVVAAALRTPPWPLLTSELDPAAAGELMDLWLQADPGVPGVNGLTPVARALAAAWQSRTGGTASCRLRQAMHVLAEVVGPLRPAPGELRIAGPEDRDLLVAWTTAFEQELGIKPAGQSESMVDSRLGRGGMALWEDRGPASMVGVTRPAGGVVRLAPVYTPPERRRRGYAGTAVAAFSRRALAHEADRCMLFTDLANPTSNKVYAEVGYRRVADWENFEFHRPARKPPARQRKFQPLPTL